MELWKVNRIETLCRSIQNKLHDQNVCVCRLETSMKNLESHLLNLLGEAERRVLELRLCGNQDNLQTKSLALWERRKRGLKKMLIGFEHASKYDRPCSQYAEPDGKIVILFEVESERTV